MKKTFKTLMQWDRQLCVAIFNWHGKKAIDRAMIAASWIGHGFTYPLAAGGIAYFNPSIRKPLLIAGVISFFIEVSVFFLLKFIVRRPRPSKTIPEIRHRMNLPDPYSFPSGHAAAAFVMAVLIGHFYPVWLLPLSAAAFVIGLSRVYNGMHFPADVGAGMVLGILSARIGLSIVL